MISKERAEEAANLLGALLGRPLSSSDEVVRSTEPSWDSIKHLELVFALEDAFDIRFKAAELPLMNSLANILAILEPYLAP
jgi:acyl carrier protein